MVKRPPVSLSLRPAMDAPKDIVHPHNLVKPIDGRKPYGIRVRLAPGDTFARLLGGDWEKLHWFGTRPERDRALEDMASEHLYSRRGDRPTLIFEPVEPADAAETPR
jgi:hypothetical protein